jgi:hypothetical protein
MDHFAPAAVVSALRKPALPEIDCLPECHVDVAFVRAAAMVF